MTKQRLDYLLVSRAFASSTDEASRIIMAGKVRVNNQVADKPGALFKEDAPIQIVGPKIEIRLSRWRKDCWGLVVTSI